VSELSLHQQAVLWGQAYEVLVKRGVVYHLIERQLVSAERTSLTAWNGPKVMDVAKAMHAALDLTDPEAQSFVNAAVEHMALTAFGTGYTVMRAYIDSIEADTRPFIAKKLTVKALWCPLSLPGVTPATNAERSDRRTKLLDDFATEFGIDGLRDLRWTAKGQPANADFILWLDYDGRSTHLLVQEYSFNMPGELQDFRDQGAHLKELERHRRFLDSRSVFARVTAEVDQEHFELSEDIRHYLLALTSENKPLYKLCQASSYATTTAELLQSRACVAGSVRARALAVTPNGLEGLAAYVCGASEDPRYRLMQQLATAYRETANVTDGDEAALTRLAAKAFEGTLAKLPKELRAQMKSLRGQQPMPGQDYEFSFAEQTTDFHNPDDAFSIDEALKLIPSCKDLDDYFGGDARSAVEVEMAARLERRGRLSLRDIHASAIAAGLQRAQPGELNLIALEGNPGIGKTTAVRDHLASTESGFLLLYVSPRVVINRDVSSSLARSDGDLTGILTLTTNSQLIATADNWHKKLVDAGEARARKIDGAVVADGISCLNIPDGSILVLTPEQEQELENKHTASKFWKSALSEYEDHVHDRALPGVLKTLSTTARELLGLNRGVNRLVLTAAIQGFRERANQKTTIEALSGLFTNKWDSLKGVDERREFARTMPTVVVMVDELAGDGAGAPFFHAIANWLRQEFLEPFEAEPSPFTVVLIASDASLSNEVVLERYLNSGARTPDKVLVSKSRGKRPFDLAVKDVTVQGRKVRALHVMTNSFPASHLTLRYSIRMTNVHVGLTETGAPQTVRQAIRDHAEEAFLDNACTEIRRALASQASQIIYFAQDKLFLRAIKDALTGQGGLPSESVQVLDSSVPGYERKRLVEPNVRDKIRVFLMTSSGARGVSFPKTDWIIASVPRFNLEAQLMEIAQLIYRGRGKHKNELGTDINGDKVPRTLVFTVDDFLVLDDAIDERQWLRQSLDLMTLLVILRSTVFTRITGDAGLIQPLALVPVGAVGAEEVVSLMSQHVSVFMKEARLYRSKAKSTDLASLATRALDNVIAIFSRADLHGLARRGSDERSYVRHEVARSIYDVACNSIRALIPRPSGDRPLLPRHMSFFGPVVVENWEAFEKQEIFAFEEHDAALSEAVRKLKGQLHDIKTNNAFPASFRNPAEALLGLLYREDHDEANEFKTLKALKSPNTWVAVPAGYPTFTAAKQPTDGREFALKDADIWYDGLARTLGSSAVIPPIPSYKSFPWAATVGRVNALNLDLVFDDRYFMASNELNLLNTLLLSRS